MSKKKVTIVIAVTTVVILAVALLAVSMRKEQAPPVITPPKTASVSITEDGFAPETIKVKTGTVVIWTNNDSSLHRVAADPFPTHSTLPALDSKSNIDQNGTYRFTFDKPGTYKYHDETKPQHSATIIVE